MSWLSRRKKNKPENIRPVEYHGDSQEIWRFKKEFIIKEYYTDEGVVFLVTPNGMTYGQAIHAFDTLAKAKRFVTEAVLKSNHRRIEPAQTFEAIVEDDMVVYLDQYNKDVKAPYTIIESNFQKKG